MTSALRRNFENQISLLRDFAFEDFIKEILLIRYGVQGFIPTRPKKDKGCDGIIVSSSTIVASYGPVKYDAKAFAKKAELDYAEYKTYWKAKYPNWQFVFNNKLGPDAITTITALHKESIPWGLDSIMAIIDNEFNSTQKRKIAELLGIPKTQISQDYLEEVLENLLYKTVTDPTEIYQYKKSGLTDVEEKIKLNYDQADIEIAMQEFESLMTEIFETGKLFAGFSDDEQDRIKSRIKTDYKNANGTFKERLKIITDNYLKQYSATNDDVYRHNVTAVLLYLFEQCLIGIKSK